MLEIVRKAADRIGGVPRLAERIGVTRQAIYQWREVPADRVGEIAQATGIARADLRPDLFGVAEDLDAWHRDVAEDERPQADFSDLRRDQLAWTEAQTEAIAARAFGDLDVDRLVGLLRSLGADARADIERRLCVVLVRLLKWRYQPSRRSLSTVAVITAERARILTRFAASPSLKDHAIGEMARIYAMSVAQVSYETGLAAEVFPVDCPFSLAELLDPAFAPAANVA